MILIAGMWDVDSFLEEYFYFSSFCRFSFLFLFWRCQWNISSYLVLDHVTTWFEIFMRKESHNFFFALLCHSSIGFKWPLQNYVSLCRGFSKLTSFVHILVGRGPSALSISYILSSGNFEIIKTSGIFVSYLMTDTFF